MPTVGGKSEYRKLTKWEKEELWLGYVAMRQWENETQATDKPLEQIDADDIRAEWERQRTD